MEGRKDDQEKLRIGLIPVRPLLLLADVYTRGAKKYADDNWRKGLAWHRVFDALQRHALAWWAGEQSDPDDGQHHLASVAWCALTLMEYEITHPELDTRTCQTTQLPAIRTGKYIVKPCAVVVMNTNCENEIQNMQPASVTTPNDGAKHIPIENINTNPKHETNI